MNFKLSQISALALVLVLSMSVSISLMAQDKVKWMEWSEVQEQMQIETRKVFVDVYTDWCGWCKQMDKRTFADDNVANYLNENYYPIKFDAEQKEDILLNGKEYRYIKQGRKGYHELAFEILKGKLSYPSIVFIDENMNVIQPIPGFRAPKELNMIMSFFAGDFYKSMPWKTYERSYQPKDDIYLSQPVKNNR